MLVQVTGTFYSPPFIHLTNVLMIHNPNRGADSLDDLLLHGSPHLGMMVFTKGGQANRAGRLMD